MTEMINLLDYGFKQIHQDALNVILDSMDDVHRFGGTVCEQNKNTVYEHISSILNIIDTLFEESGVDNDSLKNELRLRAVLHDLGEVAGEISTVTQVLNGKAISKSLKDKIEHKIFEYFLHMAILSLQDKKPFRFYAPLSVLRKLIDKINQGDNPDLSHKALLTYMEQSILDSPKHSSSYALLDEYLRIETEDSYAARLFKIIDKIEGSEFFVKNTDITKQLDLSKAAKVREYYMEFWNKIGEGTDEDLEPDLTQAVKKRLMKVLEDYELLMKQKEGK